MTGFGVHGARHRRGLEAEAERGVGVPAEDVDADAQERRRDELTATRALAREERGGDAAGERHARRVIAHRAALERRLAAGRRERRGDARARPERADVVRRPIGVGAALAVAGDAARRRGAGCAPPGARQSSSRRASAATRMLVTKTSARSTSSCAMRLASAVREVQHDAPLAAVVELEGRVRGQLGPGGRDVQAAERIAVRRLDLDHLGAPVGEHGAGGRSGDPQARARRRVSPPAVRPCSCPLRARRARRRAGRTSRSSARAARHRDGSPPRPPSSARASGRRSRRRRRARPRPDTGARSAPSARP